jgi:hypothetical protein
MTWLASPERFFKPSRSRAVFLCVGVAAFCVTELGRFVVRPYVREHGIDDLGLTDSIGNLGGIIVQIFIGLAILNASRKQSYRLAAFFAAGYVVYECLQPLLPRGVFDWNDIYATGIGFGVSVLLVSVVWGSLSGSEGRT